MSQLRIAGVDEAGRGPLAGPVIAAAVILDPQRPIAGLRDSKLLTAARRERLAQQIRTQALAVGIGRAEVSEIDALNILRASLLAMGRALHALPVIADEVWVDGLHRPQGWPLARPVPGGDRTVPAISAASIIAKVTRDRELVALDACYPGYGFARHKGYPSAAHRAALAALGPCPEHRRSFAPVREALAIHGLK